MAISLEHSNGKRLSPLHDNVLVRPLPDEVATKSGIVIPDSATKDKPMRGEVIAVGPGKLDANGKRHLMDVKPSDIVIFTQYAPTEVKFGGEKLYIMSEDSVLAVEATLAD